MYLAHDEFLDRNATLKVLRGWYEEDKQLGERVSFQLSGSLDRGGRLKGSR